MKYIFFIPGIMKNKIFQTVFAISISQMIIAQSLVLQTGASLYTTGTVIIAVQNGDVINNGSVLGTGKLLLNGTALQNISGTGIISNLELNNAGGATITSGAGNMESLTGTLTITNGALNTSGNLTLKSTLNGTANVAAITGGSVSGNVIVERYFANKRAWRLLGIPFNTSAQTIKAAWMEGAANSSANPSPGYGTHITTFAGDANAANFDATKPASSIRTYSADNFNSDAAHTPNTTSLITANSAYFLFVRGDRSADRTATTASSEATLRISGAIKTGNVTAGISGTGYTLISNPYPSPIDFDAIKAIGANTGIIRFYVWDATLGTIGQYRTVDIGGSAPNFIYTATPGGANNNYRFIESGSAFFIPGNNTVSFTEATKSSAIPPASAFRTTTYNQTELNINFNIVNADNSILLADGVREVFNNSYALAVDNDDAKKIEGFDLNLGILNKNEVLAIEKRPLPKTDDIIPLKLWNTVPGNYQFEIFPQNLPAGLTCYLLDNYLNGRTLIDADNSSSTKINFSITSDAASASANRFSLVFGKDMLVNTKPAIVLYPNPVQNGIVSLQFNNMPKGIYNIQLSNSLGQILLSKQINHAEGTATETIAVNKIKGAYLLEIVKPDKSKSVDKVIIN